MTTNSKDDPSRLKGVMTALVTPFQNGVIDHDALATLSEWHVQCGIDALVPCGTTGEAPTLAWDERLKIIRTCVRISRGRVPVIAGTGTNSTELTIAHTSAAQSCGADAALIVTPYYNMPSQEGIVRHFEAIAQSTNLPIIIYNVPSRTGVDLTMHTLDRLAQIPSIIGIKDATGEVKRVEYIRTIFHNRFYCCPVTTRRHTHLTCWAAMGSSQSSPTCCHTFSSPCIMPVKPVIGQQRDTSSKECSKFSRLSTSIQIHAP
jgi:4-hydroxy-tetrahydrodipicolinate synthase